MNSTMNLHGVTTATVAVYHVKGTHWLSIRFEDAQWGSFCLSLFCESPEALLESLRAPLAMGAEPATANGAGCEAREATTASSGPDEKEEYL